MFGDARSERRPVGKIIRSETAFVSVRRAAVQRRRAEITALEKEIAELEVREKELMEELEKPETYATGGRATQINRELMEVHDRLAGANTEWETAGMELAQFEAEAAAT